MRVNRWSAPLGAALVLCGCNDIPMGGRNVPEAEARSAPVYHVVASSAEARAQPGLPLPDVRLGGQAFTASGGTLDVPDRFLRSAGAVEGRVFYALTWDTPPHDRLLVAQPDGRWQEYLPVVGGDRAGGSAEAAPSNAHGADTQADTTAAGGAH